MGGIKIFGVGKRREFGSRRLFCVVLTVFFAWPGRKAGHRGIYWELDLTKTRRCRQNVTFSNSGKGSPWENGYVESFNGTLRDELLNREIFLSFEEACWVIDRWRLDYKHHRIHSSLDYQTPVAYAAGCVLSASGPVTGLAS